MEAFVYVWNNLTDNKKYIGYHKGDKDDGYISSSSSKLFWDDFNDNDKKWDRGIVFEGTATDSLQYEQDLLKQIDLKSSEYYNNARGAEIIFTDEVREKIRQHHTGGSSGMKGKKHSEETKLKIKQALKNIAHDDEWNKKVSAALLGKKKSAAHILQMKKGMSGTTKNVIKKTCEHCHKQFNPNMYYRWHGENCKLTNNNKINL
jgi:hypothetical protein